MGPVFAGFFGAEMGPGSLLRFHPKVVWGPSGKLLKRLKLVWSFSLGKACHWWRGLSTFSTFSLLFRTPISGNRTMYKLGDFAQITD